MTEQEQKDFVGRYRANGLVRDGIFQARDLETAVRVADKWCRDNQYTYIPGSLRDPILADESVLEGSIVPEDAAKKSWDELSPAERVAALKGISVEKAREELAKTRSAVATGAVQIEKTGKEAPEDAVHPEVAAKQPAKVPGRFQAS